MRRIIVLAAFLIALALGNTQPAYAYRLSAQFTEKLGQLQCADLAQPDPNGEEIDERRIIAMFAPWSPNIHQQLAGAIAAAKTIPKEELKGAAKPADAAEKFVSGEWGISGRVRDIAAQQLAPIERRILADAQTYGHAVCDVMRVQAAFGAEKLYKLKKAKPDNASPYAAIGQALMTAAGCDVGPLDGSIGTNTIALWDKLFPDGALAQQVAAGPKWLLDLYALNVVAPSCNPAALQRGQAGFPLSAVAELYAVHRTVLLGMNGDGGCGLYPQAMAGYATTASRTRPDAALARQLDYAFRGLKATLHCLEQADDIAQITAIGALIFGQGLHRASVDAAEPDVKFDVATMLLLPGTPPDFAGHAITLLRAVHETASKPAPAPQPQSDEDAAVAENMAAKAATLIAWAYDAGVGVARDEQQARQWQNAARKSADDIRGRTSNTSAGETASASAIEADALWLLGQAQLRKAIVSEPAASEEESAEFEPQGSDDLLVLKQPLGLSLFPPAAELADLYVRAAPARATVSREANSFGKFVLATIMAEGHLRAGKSERLAIALFQEASNEGYSAATIRLAQAYEQGFGVPADLPKAIALYKQAAAAGEVLGHLELARFHDDGLGVEQDLQAADRYYRAAMQPLLKAGSRGAEAAEDDPLAENWFNQTAKAELAGEGSMALDTAVTSPAPLRLVNGLMPQMIKASAYFSSQLGEKLLADLVKTTPMAAVQFGQLYLCADCGSTVKPALAAQWYRRGAELGSLHSSFALARLVAAFPELARKPGEAEALLKTVAASKSARALEADLLLKSQGADAGAAGVDPAVLKQRIMAGCNAGECLDLVYRLALGAVSPNLVKVGYELLLDLWKRPPPPDDSTDTGGDARAALVDVLSLYGNFREALALLRQPETELKDEYGARNQTFSRLILAIADSKGKDLSGDFDELLAGLELKGDTDAAAFRQALADRQAGEKPAPAVAVDTAREAFDAQLAVGGFSHALVTAGRTLSRALAEAGKKNDALAYELVALNAQTEMTRASSVETGPLPSRLSMACQLARSSQRVQVLGFGDVATVLAKEAVNKLQDVRQALIGLPQNFRTCFADLTADQYRLLFSLFVSQGREAEAEAVSRMLKDAETYDYVGLDQTYVHHAFDKLPLSGLEQDVLTRALGVKPVVNQRTERYQRLKQRRAAGKLTAPEKAELTALEADLRKQDASFRSATGELVTAIAALTDPDHRRAEEQRLLDRLEPVKGILRQTFDGKAAALHFVVLPDRMHAILTTTSGQTSYTWRQLGSEPFSEERLNRMIDTMRRGIDRHTAAARDGGEQLYRVLFQQSSFDRELASAGTHTLLLSLDRRLRYLPFAALWRGDRYLAEDYALVMLTDSAGPSPSAAGGQGKPAVSAFATTAAIGGFEALPHAAQEVAAIARTYDRPDGVKPSIKLDRDFTLAAFQDAFAIGPSSPDRRGRVVHVASHFQADNGDDKSFLLLGNGDRLPVKEIKDNGSIYDFGDVDLLTLSACATAYAPGGQAQGQDLESFASVVQRKGARAVLASLWPVSDGATAALMERFYALQAENKMPRSQALATVQREFIKADIRSRADPFYWAPFVLFESWQ